MLKYVCVSLFVSMSLFLSLFSFPFSLDVNTALRPLVFVWLSDVRVQEAAHHLLLVIHMFKYPRGSNPPRASRGRPSQASEVRNPPRAPRSRPSAGPRASNPPRASPRTDSRQASEVRNLCTSNSSININTAYFFSNENFKKLWYLILSSSRITKSPL